MYICLSISLSIGYRCVGENLHLAQALIFSSHQPQLWRSEVSWRWEKEEHGVNRPCLDENMPCFWPIPMGQWVNGRKPGNRLALCIEGNDLKLLMVKKKTELQDEGVSGSFPSGHSKCRFFRSQSSAGRSGSYSPMIWQTATVGPQKKPWGCWITSFPKKCIDLAIRSFNIHSYSYSL